MWVARLGDPARGGDGAQKNGPAGGKSGRAVACTLTGSATSPSGKDRLHMLPTAVAGASVLLRILRKEVIQPQVPLRLPCYDLVPIAEFIFGA